MLAFVVLFVRSLATVTLEYRYLLSQSTPPHVRVSLTTIKYNRNRQVSKVVAMANVRNTDNSTLVWPLPKFTQKT